MKQPLPFRDEVREQLLLQAEVFVCLLSLAFGDALDNLADAVGINLAAGERDAKTADGNPQARVVEDFLDLGGHDAAGAEGAAFFEHGDLLGTPEGPEERLALLDLIDWPDEGGRSFMLRVRLTELEHADLQTRADQETAGDMSKLVRRQLFGA